MRFREAEVKKRGLGEDMWGGISLTYQKQP